MVLAKLKAATKPYHEKLETDLDILKRLTSPEDYRFLLGGFYGFYAPVETIIGDLAEWQSISLDFQQRRKTALLKKDLTLLGTPEHSIRYLPTCSDLPALENLQRALGCMYVLEGATLGGQIISRHLKQKLGLSREDGVAFFNCYAAEVGPMWKSFGAFLNAYAVTDQIEAAVVDAACETFIKMDKWLSEGRWES